jgi:hypothetical protein
MDLSENLYLVFTLHICFLPDDLSQFLGPLLDSVLWGKSLDDEFNHFEEVLVNVVD